jgi:hypothetical protein
MLKAARVVPKLHKPAHNVLFLLGESILYSPAPPLSPSFSGSGNSNMD